MCSHYFKTLTEEDRHYIDSPEDDNCVLCLVERKGPMSQDEVGKYLKLSKMRISQLEKSALKKLKSSGRSNILKSIFQD